MLPVVICPKVLLGRNTIMNTNCMFYPPGEFHACGGMVIVVVTLELVLFCALYVTGVAI